MIKRYGDIVAGVIFLVLTWFYYQGTFLNLKFKLSKYGADFVPRIYCLIMALVAVGLIVRGVLALLRAAPEEFGPVNRGALVKVSLTVLLIAVYIVMLRPVGFVLSTIFYLAAQVLITAPRRRIRPLHIVVFAVGVTCFLNFLFLHVFYLALPSGLFGF